MAIYGLSGDSVKANTSFKAKQKLPYPLLCDPGLTLISALGFKKGPKSTTRGIFIIDKAGQVLAAQPGGPEHTLDAATTAAERLIYDNTPGGANRGLKTKNVKMNEGVGGEMKPGVDVNGGEGKGTEETAAVPNGAATADEKGGVSNEKE